MRAVVCHAPLDLRLDPLDTEVLGPRQARVRVAFGGICGSDLHYYRHGGFGTVRLKEPMVRARPGGAPRGVIVSVGLGGDVQLPLNQLVGKELELRGTFRFHCEFAVAVNFLNQRLIDGRPVISHTVDLADAGRAFELAGDKSQAIKVQIAFGASS